jgi:hypothetical protein
VGVAACEAARGTEAASAEPFTTPEVATAAGSGVRPSLDGAPPSEGICLNKLIPTTVTKNTNANHNLEPNHFDFRISLMLRFRRACESCPESIQKFEASNPSITQHPRSPFRSNLQLARQT